MIKLLVLLVAILLAFSSTTAEARIRLYKWEVKYEFKSPDCLKKLVIAINGRTPGPTIEAEQGDTVIVEVKNTLLTENLSIHWHGIRQVTLKILVLVLVLVFVLLRKVPNHSSQDHGFKNKTGSRWFLLVFNT